MATPFLELHDVRKSFRQLAVVHRFELRATLARLLDLLRRRDRADEARPTGGAPAIVPAPIVE